MGLRHLGVADAGALEPAGLDEAAGEVAGRVLEDAAGVGEAVRLALAAWLESADFSLGPSGLLPGRFVETVESVFAARGLLPQLTAVEKDQTLQVAIVLLPAAAPPGSRQAASEHAGE